MQLRESLRVNETIQTAKALPVEPEDHGRRELTPPTACQSPRQELEAETMCVCVWGEVVACWLTQAHAELVFHTQD